MTIYSILLNGSISTAKGVNSMETDVPCEEKLISALLLQSYVVYNVAVYYTITKCYYTITLSEWFCN